MIRSGSPFPLLMGLLALSVGGAKLAHTVEPHDLGDKAEGIERVGLAPQTSHQHKALRSAAEPQDLGEEDELQTGWGRRRRRRRRYGDNRRRYRDNRRRFVDNRRRMHCRIPTRRGTDFNSCRSTTSRRRTTCTARCKPGFSGSARTVTCEERHDAPGDLNSHHFPSCSPKACGARQTLDQATIAQCVLDHTGQKPYTGNCVMSGFDRSDCNGKVFEDTCRVTCKVGWSGSAATLSCPTNTVLAEKIQRAHQTHAQSVS